MVQQTLQNKLRDLEVDREVVTLITQVLADKNDKSIKNPTKFVGARYTKEEIDKLAKKLNWNVKEQEPGSWRRVVPSPMPEYIMHGKSWFLFSCQKRPFFRVLSQTDVRFFHFREKRFGWSNFQLNRSYFREFWIFHPSTIKYSYKP